MSTHVVRRFPKQKEVIMYVCLFKTTIVKQTAEQQNSGAPTHARRRLLQGGGWIDCGAELDAKPGLGFVCGGGGGASRKT